MLRYIGPPMPTTSANLRGMIGDETGTGALVFAESPTLVTPALGAASATSLSLTNPLTVANGGSGVATLADAGVLIGNGTGAVQVTGAGTSGQVLTSNGAGVDPTFQANTGSGWTDDGTVVRLTTSTDSVGIGTTAPGSGVLLHLENSAGPTFRISRSPAASYPGTLDLAADGSAIYISSAGAALPVIFRVDNVEKMRVHDDGKVGIGTSTPGALLDIGLAGTTLGVIRLEGSTSGYAAIQPTAVAGSVTITLPATTGTVALTANALSVFAATTSAQLAGVISDETGTGALVFGTSPTISTSLTISGDNAAPFVMDKSTVAVTAPGAGKGMIRWENGTNAGTLKLVAYSGTSTTGVTIVDNVGSGN